MQDLSFASATRTLTYELHFASMYGPGLLTAKLIDKCGVAWAATLGGGCFGASVGRRFVVQVGDKAIGWLEALEPGKNLEANAPWELQAALIS